MADWQGGLAEDFLALALVLPMAQAQQGRVEAASTAAVTVNAGSIVDSEMNNAASVVDSEMNNPVRFLNQSGLKSAATAGPSFWQNLKNGDTRYVRAWFKPTKYYNRTTSASAGICTRPVPL
ncbi:hypothetical protein D3C75_624300 [compost metagenome]